jgi:ATP-dependent 26S proteasome regulatory subunit
LLARSYGAKIESRKAQKIIKTLDPAFIRRGRIDQHIELSQCKFEGFEILAKNCLHIESHALFDKIKALLEEINRTPADAVEYLTPNSLGGG